jgi:N-methylhydantoinase A
LKSSAVATRYRVAVDIGGTFTDFVLRGSEGQLLTYKLSSTTDDYGRAIVQGLRSLSNEHGFAPEQVVEIVHGTTVGANTVLEGKGAKTALITTHGFRDVLELRRVRLAELYNMNYARSAPLVQRRHRYEVRERINFRGNVVTPLNIEDVERALEQVAKSGAESVAICLIHSYANAAHEEFIEQRAREVLPVDCFVSASYRVLPEIQEYERTSTTVINAYIGPAIRRYCRRLRESLSEAGFHAPIQIMQSSGGILSIDEVLQHPAQILESGPAAGVIGAATVGIRWGEPNLLTVDMGGTTAKAALIEDGRPGKTNEYEVGAGINVSSKLVKGRGHALKLPVIDISEIGAGGGSIARVSSHATLSVGPDSAGAAPGPACYCLGGKAATLTDAMVALGYLNPRYLIGGALKISFQEALRALQNDVAHPLNLPLLEAAHGVYTLAATTMTRAVKAVSTFRGRDPRDFTLFAFGGNGPLMAAEIASALEIKRIRIPRFAGLFSAVGLLNARMEREVSRTWLRSMESVAYDEVEQQFQSLERDLWESCRTLERSDQMKLQRQADLRYHGQAFELTVDVLPSGADNALRIRKAFAKEHFRTYGHGAEEDPIDLVTLRVVASLPAEAGMVEDGSGLATGEAGSSRQVYFGPHFQSVESPVLHRGALEGGIDGPLVIEEHDTTILVPPGWKAMLGSEASVILERSAR